MTTPLSFGVVGARASPARMAIQCVQLPLAAPERSPSLVAYGQDVVADTIVDFDDFVRWQHKLLDASAKTSLEKRQRLSWLLSELNRADALEGRRECWRARQADLEALSADTQEAKRLEAGGEVTVAMEWLGVAVKRLEQSKVRELVSVRDGDRLAAGAVDQQNHYLEHLKAKASAQFIGALDLGDSLCVAALEAKLKAVPEYVSDEELAPYLERLQEMRKPFTPSITTLSGSCVVVEVTRLNTTKELKNMLAMALSVQPYRVGLASASGEVLLDDAKTLEENGICDARAQLSVVLGPLKKFVEMSDEDFNNLLVERRLVDRRHLPGLNSDEGKRMAFRHRYIPRLEAMEKEVERQEERNVQQARSRDLIAGEAEQLIKELGCVGVERITHKTEAAEGVAARCAQRAQAIKEHAQQHLDEVLPEFSFALQMLDRLDKRDFCEMRAFSKPPQPVVIVAEALCIMLGEEPTWNRAKVVMSDANLLDRLRHFDKDNIPSETIDNLQPYLAREELDPNTVNRVSRGAYALCLWVRSMCTYDRVLKVVGPLVEALPRAEEQLEDAVLDHRAWAGWAEVAKRSARIADESSA